MRKGKGNRTELNRILPSVSFSCFLSGFVRLFYFILVQRDEETDEEAYCAGDEPENQSVEEHKSVILHLLSQLKLGMDLTKVL